MTNTIPHALVIGGGSGMGQIWARRMAEHGTKVALIDVNEAGMRNTAQGLENIYTYVCDVTDLARLNETVERIEQEIGVLDRAIHSAAIMPTSPLLKESPERIKKIMRINYEGTVNVAHAVLNRMLERNQGEFIVFGSVAAQALTPQLGAYCASKAAVNAFVEVLQYEHRESNVRIHLACPPLTDTPLVDQARKSSNPKYIQQGYDQKIVADPNDIVDKIERAFSRGKLISYPHYMAKGLHYSRRFAPGLLRKVILRAENG